MTFIKHHWFGLIVSLFVLAYFSVFVAVLLSPRNDEQKRGFIPCTEAMAEQLVDCQSGVWCMLKTIIKNSWCDAEVIGQGAKSWIKGDQKTPWANYLFVPETAEPEEKPDEGLQEFYTQTPDVKASMQNVRRLNKELEEKVKPTENEENKQDE